LKPSVSEPVVSLPVVKMAPCGSQDLTDKRRKEILLCCDTIQGCSDILAVGIGGLSQHCKPATPDADVHSSLIGALTHLQSYHGPSDSLILPHAGGKSVPSLEGARQQSGLLGTTACFFLFYSGFVFS
jgi:hypothetical protein